MIGINLRPLQGLLNNCGSGKLLEQVLGSLVIYSPHLSPHPGPSSSLQHKVEILYASSWSQVCLTCCTWAVVSGLLAGPAQTSHVQRRWCFDSTQEITEIFPSKFDLPKINLYFFYRPSSLSFVFNCIGGMNWESVLLFCRVFRDIFLYPVMLFISQICPLLNLGRWILYSENAFLLHKVQYSIQSSTCDNINPQWW